MSCKEALIKNAITLPPDATVDDALRLINDREIRTIPVVDADNRFVGMFGLHCLMEDLLPMAARMEGGITDLGFVEGGAPGAAKRIRKLAPLPLKGLVEKTDKSAVLSPDLPMLEVIRRLAEFGSPLPVVDDNHSFIGLVSEQSCLSFLNNVLKDVEAEEKLLDA